MPILMFISILVFRPERQIWNPVRRDTRINVRRILNASRISLENETFSKRGQNLRGSIFAEFMPFEGI